MRYGRKLINSPYVFYIPINLFILLTSLSLRILRAGSANLKAEIDVTEIISFSHTLVTRVSELHRNNERIADSGKGSHAIDSMVLTLRNHIFWYSESFCISN